MDEEGEVRGGFVGRARGRKVSSFIALRKKVSGSRKLVRLRASASRLVKASPLAELPLATRESTPEPY